MSGIEQLSVYNVLLDQTEPANNPLHFLLPEHKEHGWHVARNPLKPLNHLDNLKRKEDIVYRKLAY